MTNAVAAAAGFSCRCPSNIPAGPHLPGSTCSMMTVHPVTCHVALLMLLLLLLLCCSADVLAASQQGLTCLAALFQHCAPCNMSCSILMLLLLLLLCCPAGALAAAQQGLTCPAASLQHCAPCNMSCCITNTVAAVAAAAVLLCRCPGSSPAGPHLPSSTVSNVLHHVTCCCCCCCCCLIILQVTQHIAPCDIKQTMPHGLG
jgi:hypothetical protein